MFLYSSSRVHHPPSLAALFGLEADAPPSGDRRPLDQFSDRSEDRLQPRVVRADPLLQGVQAPEELLMAGQDAPNLDERPHDGDVDFDGALAPEHAREHGDALFREDEVGSLEVGKFADMLVVSGDPLGDPFAIKDIAVWMTMIGGQTEYCADGQAAYCP